MESFILILNDKQHKKGGMGLDIQSLLKQNMDEIIELRIENTDL